MSMLQSLFYIKLLQNSLIRITGLIFLKAKDKIFNESPC